MIAKTVELSGSETWYSLSCHKLRNKCKCETNYFNKDYDFKRFGLFQNNDYK